MDDLESEKRNITKRALLESARDLVAERGSDRISIQEITKRADVATGTYYNYFETKRDIFVAVALHLRSQMQQDLEPVRNKIKDPAMRVIVDHALENQTLMTVGRAVENPEITKTSAKQKAQRKKPRLPAASHQVITANPS